MQHFSNIKGTLQLSLAKYNFLKNCHMKTWLTCAASQNCRFNCRIKKTVHPGLLQGNPSTPLIARKCEHLHLEAQPGHCSPGLQKQQHPDLWASPTLYALETALKLQISISSHLTAMHLFHESALKNLTIWYLCLDSWFHWCSKVVQVPDIDLRFISTRGHQISL